MWKDYSKSYMESNRASSLSIAAAAFIATLFLSFLCSLAYNFWTYDIESIVLDEGDWQGRLVGELQESDIPIIEGYHNVKKAVVNDSLHNRKTDEKSSVIDVYFYNARTIYKDMPQIQKQLGLGEDAVYYHDYLLSRYLIHDPADSTPPLLLTLYLAILFIVSLSLVLIIRNSFELSMNSRIHQFGILSSVGATPRQIRFCLLQEAAVLCGVPILAGCISGILVSFGIIKLLNFFAENVPGRHEAVFGYHPMVLLLTLFAAIFTVLVSAWIPARKLSKMTPLEAIRDNGVFYLRKRRKSRLLSLLFGIEGELAGNALKAQKKALRISTISLLLSFLGFSLMLCFTKLSEISTRYTYFERYQDVWDVMLTVKDTDIIDFDATPRLKEAEDIGDIVVYQKAQAKVHLMESEQSDELLALGGMEKVASAVKSDRGFWIDAQLVVLDDSSFIDYCKKIGVSPDLNGGVILNEIWDSVNSNFRNPTYIPFVNEEDQSFTLYSEVNSGWQESKSAEAPVIAYTNEAPVLREEYDDYSLVQFIPETLWRNKFSAFHEVTPDTYIRILADEEPTAQSLGELENRLTQLMGQDYRFESENRIQERISNDEMIKGMIVIFGGFCVLLAMIGVANVFSNTLGFIRQRKREFAQYMSIGLTPEQMRRMFGIEAVVIAGKPLMITMLLTVVCVQLMITASYLNPIVFWREAPIIPILLFAVAIMGFVSLAYYIGGKRILECDLNETLRNDAVG